MCVYIRICVWVFAHVCGCPWRPEGNVRSLELQEAVTFMTYVLGTELSSSGSVVLTREPSLQTSQLSLFGNLYNTISVTSDADFFSRFSASPFLTLISRLYLLPVFLWTHPLLFIE